MESCCALEKGDILPEFKKDCLPELPLQAGIRPNIFFQFFNIYFSVPVVLHRVIENHNKEGNYHQQEAEETNRVPEKAYSCPSFSPGNQYGSLKHCRNNHTGEGKHEDKHNIKDLCNNAFLCH
jgi:hypothetical protein